MFEFDDDDLETWDEIVDTICASCERFARVNDVGLCRSCAAKLERDLIRSRDWDASAIAFTTPETELENLRLQIMREYGAAYELIVPSTKAEVKTRKQFQRIAPPPLNQNLPEISPYEPDNYTELDVIAVLEQILASTPHYTWRELQEVSMILRRYFPDLNPKAFGHKNLRRLVQAHPKRFQTQWDDPKKRHSGQLYIRLTKDHTRKPGE